MRGALGEADVRIRIEWRRRTPVKLFFSLIIIYRIHATTGGGAGGISITLFLKKKGGPKWLDREKGSSSVYLGK